MSKYEELIKKHGTVAEFKEALDKAFCDLMITKEEANKALIDYLDELTSARLADRKAEEYD